jgi:hypothetical protein
MSQYKESYLEVYLDNFKFLDPECHDVRVREINMRTKRCNRCLGFNECKRHPHFWLFGEQLRLEEDQQMPEDAAEAKATAHVAPYQKVITRHPYDIPEAEAPV